MTANQAKAEALGGADVPRFRRAAWLRRAALAALLASFAAFGLAVVNTREDPGEMDTARYLDASLSVKEQGGALALPWLCVTGAYTEAVQQPLYHAALSLVAGRDFAFFNRAKLVTLAIGVAAVATVYLAGASVFGKGAGLFAALLVSLGHAFVFHTTMVACESLLMIWVVAAWAAAGRKGGARRACLPAAGLGLAFLTKASVLILAPVFLAYDVLSAERGARVKRGLVWAGVFLLVVSPILVRNTVVYGAPFYNPHSQIMWLETWEDAYRPHHDGEPPSALSYLRRHSVGHVLGRLSRGVVAVGHEFYRDGLGLFGTPPAWREPTGLIVLVLGLGGMAMHPRRSRAVFSLACIAVFILAFGWYRQVAAGSRFLLPMAPILALYAGHSLSQAARLILRRMKVRRLREEELAAVVAALVSVGLFFGVTVRLESLRANPLRVGRTAPGFDFLRAWLQERVGEGEVYAHGPSRSYTFSWNTSPPLKAVPLPLVESFGQLEEWIVEQGIRWVVVDFETAHRRRDALRGVVAPPPSRDRPPRALRLPEGWGVAYPGGPERPFAVMTTPLHRERCAD